jgi:aspartokinase-like uncharacterized kinase
MDEPAPGCEVVVGGWVAAAVRGLTEHASMSENDEHDMSLEAEYATLDAEVPEPREQAEASRRLLGRADAPDG